MDIFKRFGNALFGHIDKKIDPNFKVALDKINKADEIFTSAINFETVFIGKSVNDANSTIKKVKDMLMSEEKLLKDELKKDFKTLNHDAFDEFSIVLTKIANSSFSENFRRLDTVSRAVIEVIYTLLDSDKLDAKSRHDLESLKKSEIAILESSQTVLQKFNRLFYDAGNESNHLCSLIDDGIVTARDWEDVKKDTIKIINDVEECEITVENISPVIKNSFILLTQGIKIDESLKDKVRESMNVIVHGTREGTKKV